MVAVFPPFVHIAASQVILQNSGIALGAQTLSEFQDGAYTGEISGDMLRDYGCRYVIVGHSERRILFNENNQVVAEKFARALACDLIPILCVGETLAERDAQKTFVTIALQLEAILSLKGGVNLLKNAVIAYEPVWAIGTGLCATPEQAEAVHEYIRAKIAEYDMDIANELVILYGGSVKANNALGLFSMKNIDGALVGGASLKAQEFLDICRSAATRG